MNAENRCQTFKKLRGDRENLDTHFQTLHDYFDIDAENITTSYAMGEELNFAYLYDSTPLAVADTLPAGIMNNLTPFGSQWMNLRHRKPELMSKAKIETFYQDMQDEVFYILSKSNFYDQAFTFYKSSGVYGTANMQGEADREDVVRFLDFPVKRAYIVEDWKGRAAEYYLLSQYTVKQAEGKFGREALSDAMKRELENPTNDNKFYDFFLYIGPRYDRNHLKKDKPNMPFQFNWYDLKAQRMVEEGGLETLNTWTHRFYKRSSQAYGFSPGMKSLMDVRFIGAMAYTELEEAMQQASPAIAVPNDAFMQDLDFNCGAVNTYSANSLTKDKIIQLGGYGNLQVNEMMLEKKYKMLKEHWFYDVFLAFKDLDKQMNNPEVFKRISPPLTFTVNPDLVSQDKPSIYFLPNKIK